MCSTDPFQFRWLKGYIYSSCNYHHQIGSINLSHCYYIFPWSCVWDFCYIIFCHVLHIYSGKIANNRKRYDLQIVFVCLSITPSHYHHCANLSVDIELIKCLPDIFFQCVSKFEHILLVIHYSICGAVCLQFAQFPRDGWENILFCLIIIIKSEVWTFIHALGLGHETMVCAVCLFIFLWYFLISWSNELCFTVCMMIVMSCICSSYKCLHSQLSYG